MVLLKIRFDVSTKVLFLLLTLFSLQVSGKIQIQRQTKVYKIKDGKPVENTAIIAKYENGPVNRIAFILTEDEIPANIKCQYKLKSNKRHELPTKYIELISNIISSNFYDGQRYLVFDFSFLRVPVDIHLSFDVTHRDLASVNSIQQSVLVTNNQKLLYQEVLPDTTISEFLIPGNIQLKFDISNKIKIDTIQADSTYRYRFTNARDTVSSHLDIQLLPDKFISSLAFINYYFDSLCTTLPMCNDQTFSHFQNLVGDTRHRDSIVKKVFEYITGNFTYIDIENGINAIKPRDPNATFLAKKGDCKDLSLLLTNVLRKFNIEAYPALGSTINEVDTAGFINIGTFNHAIVAIKKEDNTFFFLDPTVQFGRFGNAGNGSTGKNFLVINKSTTPTFHVVKGFYDVPNKETLSLSLSQNGNRLTGEFKVTAEGTAENLWMAVSQLIDRKKLTEAINSNLLNSNFISDSISFKVFERHIEVTGAIELKSSIISTNQKNYIPLTFLPYPNIYSLDNSQIKKEFCISITVNDGFSIQQLSGKIKPDQTSSLKIESLKNNIITLKYSADKPVNSKSADHNIPDDLQKLTKSSLCFY